MADRIITMRALLKKNLEELGSKHDWSHITSQVCITQYRFDQKLITNANGRLACSLILV